MHDYHGNPENPLIEVVEELGIEELVLERKEDQKLMDVVEKREYTDKEVDRAYDLLEEFDNQVDKVAEETDQDISVEKAGIKILRKVKKLPPPLQRCFNTILNGL